MASWDEFGGVVSEWARATGEQFNSQWYGAAPGEYRQRMESSARSWYNNKAERDAQIQAEALRKRLEEEQRLFNEGRARRDDDFKRWADLQIQTADRNYASMQEQNALMRDSYNAQLNLQQQQAQEQRQRYEQEMQRQEQVRQQTAQAQQATGGIINTYQNALKNASPTYAAKAGGHYQTQLQNLLTNYSDGMAAYVGSPNTQAATAAAQQLQGQYGQQAESIVRQYEQQRADSVNKIQQASQQADTTFSNFNTALTQQQQQFPGISANLGQDLGIGINPLAQQFEQQYRGLLDSGAGQASQQRQGQQGVFNTLLDQASNPSETYTQDRDRGLNDSQRFGFLTQLYNPNFTGIQGQYAQIDPLAQQAQDIYTKTYGYDQEKLQSYLNPISQTKTQAQQTLAQGSNTFGQGLGGLLSGLGSGLYDQSTVAMKQAQQNNVNQQLRAFEQQMMGTISQYYNTFANYATKAENEFNTQKSFRMNEKQNLLASQQTREVDQRTAQARGQAERGRATQLGTIGGYDPYSLLSSLSRGNY